MNSLIIAQEGARMFQRRIRVAMLGTKKYGGNAENICESILKDCWNGTYLQVSAGHFPGFYARDFGWVVSSLLELGEKEKVEKTLAWALACYEKKGKIMIAINKQGKPFDFPTYGIDALNYMLYSLRFAKQKELTREHEELLEREIQQCYDLTYDESTGLVKKGVPLSSLKDHALRTSSCYDNVMLACIQNNAKLLGLKSPFKKDIKKAIKNNFWNGYYFLDDLSGNTHVAGDANLFPFWTHLFTEKAMMKKAFATLEEEGLTKPFPIKYTKSKSQKMIFLDIFALGYQTDAIWMHIAPLYIEMLAKIDKEKAVQHLLGIKGVIERDKNYIEVYTSTGKPFSSPFYYADEGMSWCANYLVLAGKLHV